MDNNLKDTLISSLLLFVALILQSTLLEFIAIGGAKPDLSLIVLVFVAIRKGKVVGQFSGLISGLIEDFLSMPTPLGFYTLIKTLIGYLYGLFQGRMFISPVLVPILLVLVATLIKFIMATLVTAFFPQISGGFSFFSLRLLFELLYNCLLTPFIFRFLKLFKMYRVTEKESR